MHGTSAHIRPHLADTHEFFAGGESHVNFVKLFDAEALAAAKEALGLLDVTIYGEAYGGKQQGMKGTYGDKLCFIAFDVQVGENWLSVPDAEQVCQAFGIEFVPYAKVSTDLAALDAERDKPSEVAVRRGCGGDKRREGVVLRPLIELRCNNGERIIVKHKGDEMRETNKPRKVADPATLEVLTKADEIAAEWVTPMRLSHVLDKIPGAQMENMREVISAMAEDVLREGAGEIVDSREARAAIGRRTAQMFKDMLQARLQAEHA